MQTVEATHSSAHLACEHWFETDATDILTHGVVRFLEESSAIVYRALCSRHQCNGQPHLANFTGLEQAQAYSVTVIKQLPVFRKLPIVWCFYLNARRRGKHPTPDISDARRMHIGERLKLPQPKLPIYAPSWYERAVDAQVVGQTVNSAQHSRREPACWPMLFWNLKRPVDSAKGRRNGERKLDPGWLQLWYRYWDGNLMRFR